MSGEKCTYVRLRQSEYNRMMRTCNRVESIDSLIRASLGRATGKLKELFNKRMARVTTRQDNVDRRVSKMSEQMRRVETDHAEKIREQAENFRKGIESLNRGMAEQRHEYTGLIEKQGRRFDKAMRDQREALEGQIRSIRDEMARKETGEREQAELWLNDTRKFLEMIGAEFRHEKFKPGALERIQGEMAMCLNNFEQGIYQAAVASSQQSYLRASELRIELEQLEMEWETYLEIARRQAAEVIAACDAQETCRFAFETEEGSREVAAEIDFWTEGALSALREKAEKSFKRLEEPDELSLDDLKTIISQSGEWSGECLDLAEHAKESLLASQLRNNIGQNIESALADSGWEITDAVYEQKDYRKAVHVKMQNLAGDEIVTIITPESGEDETIQNRVDISFFDRSTNDEMFRIERLNAITKILREEGLECTPPVCAPGSGDGPCTDLEKLDFEKIGSGGDERH